MALKGRRFTGAVALLLIAAMVPACSSAPKAPDATDAGADKEAATTAKQSVYKIYDRSEQRGARFLEIGGKEVVSINQLPTILTQDTDPDVMKEMSRYRLWSKMTIVANIITIAAGVGAFYMWSKSVNSNQPGSTAAYGLFGLALGSTLGLRLTFDNMANKALGRAENLHNDHAVNPTKSKKSEDDSAWNSGFSPGIGVAMEVHF